MFDGFDLSNKTALVTGASSGLGAHFAKVLAAQGATVALAARRMERLHQLVEHIQSQGGKALAVKMDVTDTESVRNGFSEAYEAVGPVNIVANNAGIASPGMALDQNPSDWDRVMDINLRGNWLVCLEAAQRLVDAGQSGSIINTASILGLRAAAGLSSYAVSKAAVVQMTRVLALEWGPKNIRVNALCPGYFITDMNREFLTSDQGQAYLSSTPAGRSGNLEELTAPFLLLASDAGSFINGVALPVDGAHSLGNM